MKKPKTAATAGLGRAVGSSATALRQSDQRKIDRLTVRFSALREQLARDAVETMREMGEVLEQGKALLGRRYTAWVEDHLRISATAGRNYIRVLQLSRITPDVFIEWKELGPSKMIRLARVDAKKRRAALKPRRGKKNAQAMTDAEFAIATKPYLLVKRRTTGNMKAHGLRMKVRSMSATLKAALSNPRITNPELKKSLAAELDILGQAVRALQRKSC